MELTKKAEAILALIPPTYDNWNEILPLIKSRIAAWDFIGYKRVETFNKVLSEQLLDNPLRFAARVAILAAIGEGQPETKKPGATKNVSRKSNKTAQPSA